MARSLADAISLDPIVAEARVRWAMCDEAEDKQRKSILQAKQFRAGDQWPEAVKLAREGTTAIAGQAPQPPRPCLTVDRLSPAVRQISNQIKSAQFMISVLPNGFGADTDTAQLLKGYLRRTQVQARGEYPVEWAADQAVEGGLGWFRLRSEYVDEFPNLDGTLDISFFDQELRLERISNNLSVYDDPFAMKPTRSDSLFRFVTEDLGRDSYVEIYGEDDLRSLDDFMSTGDPKLRSWVKNDSIRIAEYWRVRFNPVKVLLLDNGQWLMGEQIPKERPAGVKAERLVRQRIVEPFKINAVRVIDRWKWLGSRIPHVPVYGEEFNVDGLTVLRGVIQEGMDAQRMVNYTYSGAIETFALSNKSGFIVAEDQLGDYKNIWQHANTHNFSYLPYKVVPGVPPPQRSPTVDAQAITAAVGLMATSENAIKATTSLWDPALGQLNSNERSGRAIQSLQGQSDVATSNYSDNVVRALEYAGELMVEVIPKITRPGQLVQILGADDEPDAAIVGQHFVEGQNGQPQPVQPGDPSIAAGLAKIYDLKQGRYAIMVDVAKATSTKREESLAALGQLIPNLPPEMAAVATPEYVEAMSFDGAHKLAEMLRKTLPPNLQPADPNAPPIPPEAQQQIAALQQQIQQLTPLANKGQTDLQKAQLHEQAENLRAEHADQTALTKAELAASATMSVAQAKVDAENFRSYVDGLETRLGKALDLHLAKVTQLVQHGHEARTQAVDHAHEAQMAELEHQHALEQGQQAAALAPPLTEPQEPAQ